MHQRMHHLDIVNKSYKESVFLVDVLELFLQEYVHIDLANAHNVKIPSSGSFRHLHIWMSLP